MHNLCTLRRVASISTTLFFLAFALPLVMFGPLSAHEKTMPDALLLPACSARPLSCHLPLDPLTGVPDNHCLDGLGVARSCTEVSPFRYINLLAVETEGTNAQRSEPEFLYIAREPESAAACVNGLAGSFPCENVDLLAFLPIEEIGGGDGSDLWGWTDPETKREYVLMGRSTGLSFIDSTTPKEPIFLGDLPTQNLDTSWRDLKVYENYVYVVSDFNLNHGVQIFDLTQLRTVDNPPVTFTPTARYADLSSAHNIAINEDTGFAYAIGGETCTAGLHMIDLQNPLAPAFAGCYSDAGYIHDTQCVRYHGPDLAYNDREICFNSNANLKENLHTLTIVDVTDKAHPLLLAKVGGPEFYYFHQGWLTEDHRYFLSNDELDESRDAHNARTYIWDLTDLHNPVVIGTYTSTKTGIDHNLYTRGTYVFEANYTSGLRILDLTTIAEGNLTEAASLDTYPEGDFVRTFSAWSAYPYFTSGVVPVSSIEGLFLTQPNLPPEYILFPHDNLLSTCAPEPSTAIFTDVVTLAAYNNYSGAVQLSFPDLELSSVYTLTTELVNFEGNRSESISITVDLTMLSTGLSTVTLQADDGQVVRSVPLGVEWARSLPAAPQVTNRVDASTTTVPLSWKRVNDATSYRVEIATDDEFNVVETVIRTTDNRFTPPDALLGKPFFWRVSAVNACGESETSIIDNFSSGSDLYLPIVGDW